MTTLRLFFLPLFLGLVRHPARCPHRVAGREDSERMGHTCAAHSLFFFLPSFLPSSLLPSFPFYPPYGTVAPRIVDFAARYWRGKVELLRSSPRNRDLHLSRRRPVPRAADTWHFTPLSRLGIRKSRVSSAHQDCINKYANLLGCQRKWNVKVGRTSINIKPYYSAITFFIFSSL